MLEQLERPTHNLARWIRSHAIALTIGAVLVALLASVLGCIYVLFSNLELPLRIALVGDVVAGAAGAMAIVAVVIAVATYDAMIGKPLLGGSVKVGVGDDVTLNTGEEAQLNVCCGKPAGGLRQLILDPVLRDLDFFITLTNTADYPALSTSCRIQFKGLTGVPRDQRGWTVVAPTAGWDRAYTWDESDRTVLNSSNRPLPALSLVGASFVGSFGKIEVVVQAQRSDCRTFNLTLRPVSS